MAQIIIIKDEYSAIKDIEDTPLGRYQTKFIVKLCNYFEGIQDIPNPTAPRQQLSFFQEQKLKEAIREFLIAFGRWEKFTTWQDVESFVRDTQYMSVFNTVNYLDEIFEVSRAADEWREDFEHIIESAHKISETDYIGDIADEIINSFFPDHVQNGSDIHDELTYLLNLTIRKKYREDAGQATQWKDKNELLKNIICQIFIENRWNIRNS
jgi:hypothetical protein